MSSFSDGDYGPYLFSSTTPKWYYGGDGFISGGSSGLVLVCWDYLGGVDMVMLVWCWCCRDSLVVICWLSGGEVVPVW